MYDANSVLQALVTKTATFSGAGYDLKVGTPRRGLKLRILTSAFISSATAGTVFTYSVQDSTDNTTFTNLAYGPAITGDTAAGAAREDFIPIETSKRYIRLVTTVSPSSGTPSISYYAELGIARP